MIKEQFMLWDSRVSKKINQYFLREFILILGQGNNKFVSQCFSLESIKIGLVNLCKLCLSYLMNWQDG
jgi:hypothetical protein